MYQQRMHDSALAPTRDDWSAAAEPLFDGLASRENNHHYFEIRSAEEHRAANAATDLSARHTHRELALLYERLSRAVATRSRAAKRLERALDDALDDSFPASDPPALGGLYQLQ